MKLGKLTAKLVREAAVLGFVEGANFGVGRTYSELRAEYPKDSDVLAWVLRSARSNDDLYPTLSKIEDAS